MHSVGNTQNFLILKELVYIVTTVFGELIMHIISVLYQLYDCSFGENIPTYNLLMLHFQSLRWYKKEPFWYRFVSIRNAPEVTCSNMASFSISDTVSLAY
jgi:hypothetical protein